MKKLMFVSLLICTIFIFGCTSKTEKREAAMKEYATKFYELHQKGDNGLTNPTVSIARLKEANELNNDGYDMDALKGCTDDSYVELQINDAKEITGVTYHLDCSK